jgi:hypothetical protein
MVMTAKYRGACARTGAAILPGDLIDYKRGKAVLLKRKPAGVDSITLIAEHGARTYYRNARGRCIDAPCCGCCTI